MQFAWKPVLKRGLPFLGLALLCLLIIPSILTQGRLLCTAVDARHFLFRLYELSWLTDRGVLWPRWAPNLSYGYGYPVFHYYGSLSFYPSLILHQLGTSLVASFQAGFWLAFVLSGWGAYIWLRSVAQDERAALVGAVAYLYIPYHINTALYRMNLPEPWALVFPPLALYGMHRMAQRLDWRSVGITALAVSALPLTSNLATIAFVPVLITYALLVLLSSKDRPGLFRRQLASAALALGLSAFFIIPAFVDRQSVQVERGFTPGGVNVFHNFLPLSRIFQQPLTTDISRANPLYDPISLGPVLLIVSLVALAATARKLPRHVLWHAAWALVITAGCVFMATKASEPVYRILSFLQVLQFPWRFLAPASLLVALLAGIASRACLLALPARFGSAAPVAITLACILLAWPLLYPGLFCDQSPNPTLGEAVAAQVGMVGSISTSAEYLPTTVTEIPATSPMFEDYVSGHPIVRWDQSRRPEGAQTLSIEDDGLKSTWQVSTPVAFEAVYQAFMFPGWSAAVDDQPVDIETTSPDGLIQVHVPAGEHIVALHFGSTPDRTIATLVSIGALIITAMLMIKRAPSGGSPQLIRWQPSSWLLVGGIGVTLLIVRVGLVDRFDWPPRVTRFDGQVIQGVTHPTTVTYSAGERLIGYDVLSRPTSGGSDLELDLYWATTTGANSRALVRLVDDQGESWTDWDQIIDFPGLIGPLAPWRWGPDRYTSMRYHVDIPPGTPPGEYGLSVATIDPDTRAPHFVIQGTPLNAERTAAIVGHITVHRQRTHVLRLAELALPGTLTPIDDTLTLVRHDVSKDRAQVGEHVVLYLTWHAESPPPIETLTLQLVDRSGQPALVQTRPFCPRYPPAQWQSGELVRDRIEVLVPASLPTGRYTWTAETGGQRIALSELTISAPERRLNVPDDVVSAEGTLDSFAALVAYRAGQLVPGQPFSITLYWRAQAETTTSYKAFVHIVDPEGGIVAQSDTVPAAWTRWTTSWLPPEVIEDTHTLTVPDRLAHRSYRVVAGLYEPQTGRRATRSNGEDNISITEIPISPR